MIWQPVDYIVAAVAGVVMPLFQNRGLSEERAKLINAVIGALIAIIALYVGAKVENIVQ